MKLYTYRRLPAGLAQWWGIDQLVVPADRDSAAPPSDWLGAVSSLNLLGAAADGPGVPPAGYAGCTRLIAGSGRAAPGSDAESSLRNWGPKAHAALDGACTRLAPVLAGAGLTLCLRPRAGDVLSDVPSCLTFLRTYGDGPFGLFLDPSALLADSMLGRAQEHLERILGALLDHPLVHAVVATNVGRDVRGTLTPAPLHSGLLDPALLVRIAHAADAVGRPVVLHPDDLAGQFRVLDAGTTGR